MRKVLLAAVLTSALPALAQPGLTVDWEWKRAHRCSSTSPSIEVAGIPEGTTTLSITLVDHDARHFDHGGGSVAHDGSPRASIPEGALKNYRGPCPPNFSSFGHDYEFTVRAIAADSQAELARGNKTKTFSAAVVKP